VGVTISAAIDRYFSEPISLISRTNDEHQVSLFVCAQCCSLTTDQSRMHGQTDRQTASVTVNTLNNNYQHPGIAEPPTKNRQHAHIHPHPFHGRKWGGNRERKVGKERVTY